MSERTTAEIAGDLVEWCDLGDPTDPEAVALHREAADRLTELDAEVARLRTSGRYIGARYAQAREFITEVRIVCDQYEAQLDQGA